MSSVAAAGGSGNPSVQLPVEHGASAEGAGGPLTERIGKVKMAAEEVFEKIQSIVFPLVSKLGESSSFCIDREGTLLTVAHNVPLETVSQEELSTTDGVQVFLGDAAKPHFPDPIEGIVHQHAKTLDLFLMRSDIQLTEEKVIPMLPESIRLKVGMKVYFAGYPLGQKSLTFHKGIISSITENEGIRRFTIDGTVVPGNSGGPVVVQIDGELFIAGVITSEIADFDPEFFKTAEILNQVVKQHPKAGTSVSVTLKDGRPKRFSYFELISLGLQAIQKNLSTGIGQAIDVRHYESLRPGAPPLEESEDRNFPVGSGNGCVGGKVIEHRGKEQIGLCKYFEDRNGSNGRGPRGIHVLLLPELGRGKFRYTLGNPHGAGNYNQGNQEDFYRKAAEKFVEIYRERGQVAPRSFEFHACRRDYTAVMVVRS